MAGEDRIRRMVGGGGGHNNAHPRSLQRWRIRNLGASSSQRNEAGRHYYQQHHRLGKQQCLYAWRWAFVGLMMMMMMMMVVVMMILTTTTTTTTSTTYKTTAGRARRSWTVALVVEAFSCYRTVLARPPPLAAQRPVPSSRGFLLPRRLALQRQNRPFIISFSSSQLMMLDRPEKKLPGELEADGPGSSVSTTTSLPKIETTIWLEKEEEEKVCPTTAATSLEPFGSVASYRELLSMAGTTLLIWLSEPLLSLVDTAAVGWTSSSTSSTFPTAAANTPRNMIPLAAMGPATTLMDAVLYMTYFLALATTNQIATLVSAATTWTEPVVKSTSSQSEIDGRALVDGAASLNNTLADSERAAQIRRHRMESLRSLQQVTSHLLGVAMGAGTLVSVFLYVAGPTIFTRVFAMSSSSTTGASDLTGALVQEAVRYCWIRGAVAPFSIVGMVAQAFLLSLQQKRRPALAMVAASGVNLIGDALLTPRWGLSGAALATAVASVTSTGLLVQAVFAQTQSWQQERRQLGPAGLFMGTNSTAANETTGPVDSSSAVVVEATMGSGVTDQSTSLATEKVPFVSWPDRASLGGLLAVSVPLALNMWAKMGSYTALTVKSSTLGVTALAAHNVLLRLFYFIGCFSDSLGQTTQAYLPRAYVPVLRRPLLRALWKKLVVIASVIGVAGSLTCYGLLSGGGAAQFLLGVQEGDMAQVLSSSAIWVAGALAVHPLIVISEGRTIASRNWTSLLVTYFFTVLIHTWLLLQPCTSLASVWRNMFIGFQGVRLVNYAMQGWFTRRGATR